MERPQTFTPGCGVHPPVHPTLERGHFQFDRCLEGGFTSIPHSLGDFSFPHLFLESVSSLHHLLRGHSPLLTPPVGDRSPHCFPLFFILNSSIWGRGSSISHVFGGHRASNRSWVTDSREPPGFGREVCVSCPPSLCPCSLRRGDPYSHSVSLHSLQLWLL